jgi:hypothetical protein
MKRIITTVIASFALLLALSALHAASGDSNDRDKEKPSTVIQLVEREHDLTFQDNGTPGPSLGDRLVFTRDIVPLQEANITISLFR